MNLTIECCIENGANKIGKVVPFIKVFMTMIVAGHLTNSYRVNYIPMFPLIPFICYTTSTRQLHF